MHHSSIVRQEKAHVTGSDRFIYIHAVNISGIESRRIYVHQNELAISNTIKRARRRRPWRNNNIGTAIRLHGREKCECFMGRLRQLIFLASGNLGTSLKRRPAGKRITISKGKHRYRPGHRPKSAIAHADDFTRHASRRMMVHTNCRFMISSNSCAAIAAQLTDRTRQEHSIGGRGTRPIAPRRSISSRTRPQCREQQYRQRTRRPVAAAALSAALHGGRAAAARIISGSRTAMPSRGRSLRYLYRFIRRCHDNAQADR